MDSMGVAVNDVFITENFLLQTDEAVDLYHRFARDLPILDYHCHLPPRLVAEDRRFENLTQIWLDGDHYKWRAMRAAGVPERFSTGNASDREKFQKWAETVPKTLCNPLYHWTHLELKRPLGISDRLLGPETAAGIWEEGNALLARPEFSCRGIMRQMNVVVACTTDDPTDTLEFHAALAADRSFPIKVLPTFRPDRALAIESPAEFDAWVDRLAETSGIDVGGHFSKFLEALDQRHGFFHAMGCRLSDHGLETIDVEECSAVELRGLFARARRGDRLSGIEIARFRSAMLHEFALWNHARGWTQQFHLGALRNANTRRLRELGPDTGFDSIGDWPLARPLAQFLDRLDSDHRLARTILYNLNPAQNEVLATMAGNFQDGSIPGKIQYGAAWWFLDQKDGMERQLRALGNLGLLSGFVGMVTDSRSFLSYTRHEYFRRVLCNLLGGEMHQGLLPRDMALVGSMVQDICYRNAARYFDFGVPA
jgi:glucuronate isomerase